jgi:hypothetical protein
MRASNWAYSGGSGSSAASPGGGTVWAANSAVASSALGNGLRYVPLRDAQSDYIEFQFVATSTGTVSLSALYAMSAASGNSVRLRLDTLVVSEGGNPSAAVTTGTAFTITPGNDTLLHAVDSGDSGDLSIDVVAGDIVYGKLYRLGTDGADTHTGDMRVIELRVS